MRTRAICRMAALLILSSAAAAVSCVPASVFEIWDELFVEPVSLQVSPSILVLQVDQDALLVASGGTMPYDFQITQGSGSISPVADGRVDYIAPASSTVAVIRLVDAAGDDTVAIVIVNDASVAPLGILPSIASLSYGESLTYSVVGGTPPYWFSVVSGLGSVGQDTGAYIAPGADTNAVVRVEDSSGQSNDAAVTVRATPPELVIDPLSVTLEAGSASAFSAMGGLGSYVFSSTGGTIDPATGAFTAPIAEGAYTVSVTDGSVSADSAVTVVQAVDPPLTIVPSSVTLLLGGDSYRFAAVGGVAPYTFSMSLSSGGSITADGLYTPATGTKLVKEYIRLEDDRGIGVTATVTLKKP